MSLIAELKRRNVFRVAVFYLVTTWLVVQIGETMMPIFDVPDWALRAVIFIMAIGFIPAIIFSWLYELTPEGLKKESEVVRDDSITHLTAKRMDLFTIGVVLLGVGFVVLDRFVLEPTSRGGSVVAEAGFEGDRAASGSVPGPATAGAIDSSVITIAVLPFVNMSSDQENEYFSDGISEELLNVLVKIKGLRVASRTSAFSFKGKDVDIPTIAAALKVRHVVEGSVRRAGDQVRITAQLIDVETDSHLWSETYTRQLQDIFAIQDEISQAIAKALQVELLGNAGQTVATHATDDVDAFEKYLLGRYYFHQRTPESLPKAIELFEEVVAIDPQFAAAFSGLADSYVLLLQYGDFDLEEGLKRARAAAATALSLDPNLAEAHASTGLANFFSNPAVAIAAYDRAIELNPSYSMAYIWKGNVQGNRGEVTQALETFLSGERVDPLHPLYAENIADMLNQMGRFEEAEARLLPSIEANPDSWLPYPRLAITYMDQGRLADAHRIATEGARRFGDTPPVLSTLIQLERRLGRFESSDYWMQQLLQVAPSGMAAPFLQVDQSTYSGKPNDAITALEAALPDAAPQLKDYMNFVVGLLRFQLQEYEAALDIFEKLEPGQHTIQQDVLLAGYRSAALLKTGQLESAHEVAQSGLAQTQAARELGNRQGWLLQAEATLLAVLGRMPEAEQKLQAVFDSGQRLRTPGDLDPVLDLLMANSSRYQELQQAVRTDIQQQLKLIEQQLDG